MSETSAPPDASPAPEPSPRRRRVFNALAWITLVLFVLFSAAITLVAAALPQIQKARQERYGR